MGIKTQKVLRLISKIILILVGVGLVGIAGYYVYRSIAFKPQNIIITNVTDSSATVTWTTTSPMKGIVYVKKDKGLLPGPLGIVGSTMAYDDRDVSDAQTACVDAFNKTASETKDSTFSVSGSNFDCENVKVTKMGSYYTHSVTMTNLDENSTYNFVVGDGIWSFKESVSTVKTFSVLDTVGEPMPVFGKITGDDGTYSRDGLVYITFRDGSEQTDSIVYSSAVNDDGGWYVDASAIRDANGNVLPLELSNDSFRIKGIYSNYGESEEVTHVYGIFEVDTFDITVKKQEITSSIWDKFINKAYAICGYVGNTIECGSYTSSGWEGEKATADDAEQLLASASTLGYGHVMQIIAGSDGNPTTLSTTEKALLTTSTNEVMSSASEIEYIADAQNITVEVEGDGMYTCADGSKVYDSTYCGGDGGSNETGAIGTNTNETVTDSTCDEGTCYDKKICLDGVKQPVDGECGYNTDEESSVTGSCTVTPTYSTSGVTLALDSCTLSCSGNEAKTISADHCKKLSPTTKRVITDGGGGGTGLETAVSTVEIDIEDLKYSQLKLLVQVNPQIENLVWDKINDMATAENSVANTNQFNDYCKSVGGTIEPVYPYACTPSSSYQMNILGVSKVYADETNDTYTLYLPEYGLYSFELGDYTLSKEVSNGETMYLFYVESNDIEGFQLPVDIDNPTSEEDIVLSSSASEITYTQESTAQQYELKKGINIISFNFVPVSTDSGAYTAKDVISQASTNGVEIQYISTFEGGRWNSGYSCSSDTCTGNNFTIVPGKGYLVYATQDGTVTIPGYNLTSSVPIAFSSGWNLVGVHGYTTAYTARSFIDSINTIEGLTANNVSWWPTSKSKYEGLEVDNGTQYGLDYSISPSNGYFVRISSFAPTDTKCKSIIWNAGGSLNGTCGNTK